MTSEHYVVLGAARPRAAWFADVGRWATSAALPVEFVRCVSADEVRARLAAGRTWSAAVIDEGCSGVDRDLLEEARRMGCAPIVVAGAGSRRRWTELGAVAVLTEPVDRDTILAVLREHASPVERSAADVLSSPGAEDDTPSADASGGIGRLVTVVGAGGTGTSTVAMALAQAAGADPANGGRVALVDAALDASLALLHDNGDVVPGLQELVELHRTGRPDPERIRRGLWACPDRGYDLLPGLRRHRDWTALRPRALDAAVTSLRRAYATVVADADADLEGEADTGSLDVEDRNACARVLTTASDVVVVTGTDDVVGVHRLVSTLAALAGHGVDPSRILPVINRAARSPRRRAETSRAVALLLGELAPGTATVSPLMLPARRELDAVRMDGSPLPKALCTPLGDAVAAVLEPRRGPATDRHRTPTRRGASRLPRPRRTGMTTIDDTHGGDLTPLAEVEHAVQARAKDIALDMGTPGGGAALRALIDEELVRWEDDVRRGRRTFGLTNPGLVAERAWRNLAGYGPLTELLEDPDVWEIEINSPAEVFVKRHSGPSGYHHEGFHDDDHVTRTLTKLLDDSATSHRKLDPSEGLQDVQLDDGSRLHIVHGDLARGGHLMVNVRRFTGVPFTRLEELVDRGTLSASAAWFLAEAVRVGSTIVFAGAPGSGKTTLLSCCIGELDPSLRVVIAEEVFEIDAPLPNVASMQTRAARPDRPGIDLRRLVAGFLRMAPDVAIVGEVRDREALPLLLTLSSGVKGFTTIHAANARGALSRIRFLAELSESARNLPHAALTTLVADAVDLVVFSRRGPDGPQVTEIMAVEDLAASAETGAFTVTDLFTRNGSDRELRWTGDVPPRLTATFAGEGRDLLATLDGRDDGTGRGATTTRHGARS